MKSSPRYIAPIVMALLALTLAVPAAAQTIRVPIDTLDTVGRSSWEEGYLSLFDMNRLPVGARMIGMGGAGLALMGGPEYLGLNPASILGVEQIQLEAEAVMQSGGGSVNEFPELLPLGEELFLESTNYRVSPRSVLDYRNLSLGSPMVIFGKRGAVALTYRRTARTGQSAETRTTLQSNAFQSNEPVTYGRGDNPDGGMDAISLGMAREFNSWLDLGAALNFQSGTLTRDDESGISTFGFTILSGFDNFDQDVSSVNLDLGARADFGRLSLAASAYLGHDLKFENGRTVFQPLPGNTVLNRYFVRTEIVDHTLSVPTMLGLGAAYEVNERLTVVGDFWFRPWGNAEITRRALDPVVGFSDPQDSTTFGTDIVLAEGEETFNAGLEDDNSFRVGLEYIAVDNPSVNIPVRFGFRSENKTLSDVDIPGIYAQYAGLVTAYYQQAAAGLLDPALEAALLEFVEHKDLLFRGDAVRSTTFAVGVGVNIESFTLDLAFERSSYDVLNFFLGGVDPDFRFNSLPIVDDTKEGRSQTNISITTRWRF